MSRRRVVRVRKTKQKQSNEYRKSDIKGFVIYDMHDMKLFQRGSFEHRTEDEILKALNYYGVDNVVGLANAKIEAMQDLADGGDFSYIHDSIPDGDMDEELKLGMLRLADIMADRIKEGEGVLVYCNAGRNRSGLLNALIIRELEGCTGEEAMQQVRYRRPRAIANESFESFLVGLKSPEKSEMPEIEPNEPEVEIIEASEISVEDVLEPEEYMEEVSVGMHGDRLFNVCLSWDLRIPDYVMNVSQGQLDKYRGKVDLMPYSHLLHKRLIDAGYGAWCYYQAIAEIIRISGKEVKKVAEYCAGVGRTTIIIQNMLEPIEHFAADINPEHCRHLVAAFPKVQVTCSNYKEMQKQVVGLSCIDNNSFTALKFLDSKHNQLDHVRTIVSNSKFTLITDTAKSRFHLNKERYAHLLDGPIESEQDYIELYSKKMYELAKASVVFVASHPRASYILFQKNVKPGDFELIQAPEEAKEYFQLADGERPITIREEAEVEEAIEEIKERPEKPKQKKDAKAKPKGKEEDDSEIKRMIEVSKTSRIQSKDENVSNIPQDNIPDIEDEDIFESSSKLKVAIVMAGGGAAGKSTASKAFAVGEPDERHELGAWYDRKDKRNISDVNVTIYDNYALSGNHKSGTDANQAPDLVRLAAWRALGHKDIVIVDGFTSSPQWVTMLNNWPGSVPLHVLLVHFDLEAEDLMDRLATRREKDKETFREKMFPKCEGLVRRAELLMGHFEEGSTRAITRLVIDKFMSPEDIVIAMDDMLHYIYEKYDLEYDNMRS